MVSHRAELLDHELAEAMDKLVIVKSPIYTSGECDPREPPPRQDTAGRLHLMGHDPRLPKMPDEANAVRLLQVSVRAGGAHAAERAARAEERLRARR